MATLTGLPGVSVVSASYGWPLESLAPTGLEQQWDSTILGPAIAAHPNVSFFASSGDYGTSYGLAYPSASPSVVSVGGTTLNLTASNQWLSETGWSYGSDWWCSSCASGGGISNTFPEPAYQQNDGFDSGGYRTDPDVSADADPATGAAVYDPYDFGAATPWDQVGGTSLAAPLWAGIVTIANQGRVLAGGQPLGATQALTDLYSLPSSDFHDITQGNNGYNAGPGYDLVTGLGSPKANLVVSDLAVQKSLVVTTLADAEMPGYTTLRDALANAATLGGSQTITFAPRLTGTIALSGGLEVSSNVSIEGPGASSLTVSGGGPSSNFSDFTVDYGVTASISGLTITNGNTSGYGGGIDNNGTAMITDALLSDNSAYDGGGILNNGVATLTNVTIAGNWASYGG
ncbi:MAG TPA: S53 family peptidase, partial [Isosphaeraceae bacterium]|nr:S53 family peptidase [Isosphaeraceae bacterium]